MIYQIENIDKFYPDAKSLFVKDWEETTEDGINFKIDEEEYRKDEAEGRLLIITAREENILAGYACFTTHSSKHHEKIIANCSGLYVDDKYRGFTGLYLLENAKIILKKVGVAKIRISTSTKNDVGRLFERVGGKAEEVIYGINLNGN